MSPTEWLDRLQLVAGQTVGIAGLGKTGQSLVKAALYLGLKPVGADAQIEEHFPEEWMAKARQQGAVLAFGPGSEATLAVCPVVWVSPGIPPASPVMKQARSLSQRLVSEIEVAYAGLECPLIAITGTNGKTTVSRLVHAALQRGGTKVALGGNIGTPLVDFALGNAPELMVVEVSSFQLAYVHSFRPQMATILNVAEDHLDWHPDFADYLRCKNLIVRNQRPEDWYAANLQDPLSLQAAELTTASRLLFGWGMEPAQGAFLRGDSLVTRLGGREQEWGRRSDFPLPGLHNTSNLLAALALILPYHPDIDQVRDAWSEFILSPHRMESAGTFRGVEFIDDSKATNVHAAQAVLAGMRKPVVLILGGKDKGCDFGPLEESIRRHVKHLVAIGETRFHLQEMFKDTIPTDAVETLPEAVRRAFRHAKSGDVVLLAPATSSFDQFKSYHHRGTVFQEAVKDLMMNPPVKVQRTRGQRAKA